MASRYGLTMILMHLEPENWDCGEETEFSAPDGVLTSHNWPDNYTNNLDCEYTISVGEDSGSLVMISFTHFDVEYESECDYDYVEVKQLNFQIVNGVKIFVRFAKYC